MDAEKGGTYSSNVLLCIWIHGCHFNAKPCFLINSQVPVSSNQLTSKPYKAEETKRKECLIILVHAIKISH